MPNPRDSCSAPSSVAAGFVSTESEGAASALALAVAASALALAIAASTTFFVGAGVNAFVVYMTTSSTLAILLLLGDVAGAFVTFGNSTSIDGLRFFGSITVLSNSGSLATSSLASVDPTIDTFGVAVDPSASASAEQLDSLRQRRKSLHQIQALWPFQYIMAGGSEPSFFALRHSSGGRSGNFSLFSLPSQWVAIIKVYEANCIKTLFNLFLPRPPKAED
jgi:hypothetical protein